jgi:hypothetical protein
VSSIRKFFTTVVFFMMVSSKAEEKRPYGIPKASPFGRGVTGGDGEGKPVRVGLLTQR